MFQKNIWKSLTWSIGHKLLKWNMGWHIESRAATMIKGKSRMNIKVWLLMVFILAFSTTARAGRDRSPRVKIADGSLEGTTRRCDDSSVNVATFLGIPYAKAPVGDLRLALPEPAEKWNDVKDATQHGPACPQREQNRGYYLFPHYIPTTGMSEDCLHLDVYTPGVNGNSPVMVYFHGGGFTYGKNSLMFNGTALAALGNIVVVSVNYRLGALGFLHDPDAPWPSNLGLRDQQLALHWVHDNIAAFGGNKYRVTIAGDDAGGVSVSAHVIAESSRGLFTGAIAQSGSVLMVPKDSPASLSFLKNLGCDQTKGDTLLGCVRERTMHELLDAQDFLYFSAVLDDDFLPLHPGQKYSSGDFARVPLLSGVTRNEGFFNAMLLVPEALSVDMEEEKYLGYMDSFLRRFFDEEVVADVREAVLEYYIPGDVEEQELDVLRAKMAEIAGDLLVKWPTHFTALIHAAQGPAMSSYFYEFAHQPSYLKPLRPTFHKGGCDHGFDTVFTSGALLVDGNLDTTKGWHYTKQEVAFSKTVLQYWTTFVKTGSPNDGELLEWEPLTYNGQHYMILKPKLKLGRSFNQEAIKFWGVRIGEVERRAKEKKWEAERDEL